MQRSVVAGLGKPGLGLRDQRHGAGDEPVQAVWSIGGGRRER